MRSRFQPALLAALAALASPAAAATEPLIVMVPQISSAAAQQLGEACVAFAAKANTATAVAVVDPAGRLLYFFARQGASATAPKTAELKAVTAARSGRATSQLMDQVKKGSAESLWLGDFPQPGGLPIIQDGHTLGAIGVAGPGGNDEKCAMAAIKAVFGASGADRSSGRRRAAARDGQGGAAPGTSVARNNGSFARGRHAMRMLMKAQLPVESGNEGIKGGSLPGLIRQTLDLLKPEAAYFTVLDGKRTMLAVFDMESAADLPRICEPLFLGVNAAIEVTPCMNADDLR